MSPLLFVCALFPLAIGAIVLIEALVAGHRASLVALIASVSLLAAPALFQRDEPDPAVPFAGGRIEKPAQYAAETPVPRPSEPRRGPL